MDIQTHVRLARCFVGINGCSAKIHRFFSWLRYYNRLYNNSICFYNRGGLFMIFNNPYSVCILFCVHNSIFLISDQNVSDIIPLPEMKRRMNVMIAIRVSKVFRKTLFTYLPDILVLASQLYVKTLRPVVVWKTCKQWIVDVIVRKAVRIYQITAGQKFVPGQFLGKGKYPFSIIFDTESEQIG